MVRKRQRAREAGVCITCCKKPPGKGRSTCSNCSENATRRTLLRRASLREREEFQQIITAHERAGDRAQTYHLFDDAAQHYQEALNVPAIAPDDRLRIVEKLGSTSLLSDNPAAATPWREDVLDAYLGNAEAAEKAIETLLQTARQRWIDSKTAEGVPLCLRAIRIAKVHGFDRLRKVATLRLIHHLKALGRFDEAAHYLENLGKIDSTDDLSVRISHHYARGIIATVNGREADAYEHHEQAIELAKEDIDLYRILAVLTDYACDAVALGNIERGKALYEQALIVVRRNHMGWLVPYDCMGYAGILARMGQYAAAHEYLLEALLWDGHAPLVEERFAAIGIPIALHVNDEAALMKCARPTAIDLAFQSLEPQRIGPVTSAFAQLYTVKGQSRKAHALLHRALEIVTYVDENIDLPLVVAQHGALADIPRARALLEARCRLPSASLPEACTFLFDAFVDQRIRQGKHARQMAMEAAERFDQLHWYAYRDLARSLIPLEHPIVLTTTIHQRPLVGSSLTITKREQQVIERVLKGYTNRQIAEKLGIREHTVEKHMGSILNRLGIRSRHQLGDALVESRPLA